MNVFSASVILGFCSLILSIMSEPILATKFFVPPQEPNSLVRQALLTRFAESQAKLCLISAPAGFGKTSLASALHEGFVGVKIAT